MSPAVSSAASDERASSVISPVPNTEEAVAIVTAMEALWPRVVVSENSQSIGATSWRFSGRWWARPHIQRRIRP
ncbi:MAG: hypothetical protein ACO3SP_08865 [Ilumatobacteraceae bacterium]